jgi:hypothetical protein
MARGSGSYPGVSSRTRLSIELPAMDSGKSKCSTSVIGPHSKKSAPPMLSAALPVSEQSKGEFN